MTAVTHESYHLPTVAEAIAHGRQQADEHIAKLRVWFSTSARRAGFHASALDAILAIPWPEEQSPPPPEKPVPELSPEPIRRGWLAGILERLRGETKVAPYLGGTAISHA